MTKEQRKEIRRISTAGTLPILIFIVVTILAECLLKYIIDIAPVKSIFHKQNFINVLIYVFVYLVLMPVLFFVYYKYQGKRQGVRLKQTLVKPKRSAGWCFKWLIIAIGISQLANRLFIEIVKAVCGIFGIKPLDNNLTFKNDFTGYIILMTSLVLFAPVFEELLFRGTICRNNSKLGGWFGIISSALIFGLWHMNYAQLALAVSFGVMLGIVYTKTQSVIPTIIIHLVNNLLVGSITICRAILQPAFDSLDKEYQMHFMLVMHPVATAITVFGGLAIIAVIIAAIVLLIIELVKLRKRKPSKGELDIPFIKKLRLYMSSPVTLLTFAVLILLTFRSLFTFRL